MEDEHQEYPDLMARKMELVERNYAQEKEIDSMRNRITELKERVRAGSQFDVLYCILKGLRHSGKWHCLVRQCVGVLVREGCVGWLEDGSQLNDWEYECALNWSLAIDTKALQCSTLRE